MGCPCAKPFPGGLERVAGDPTFYCGPRRVGKHTLLCGVKEGRFPQHCMVGPNWPCMLVTYALILAPTCLLLVYVTGVDHWIATVAVCFTGCLLLTAFSATACSDPGIVYRRVEGFPPREGLAPTEAELAARAMEAGDVLCGRCDVKRPIGAIHCHDCDVCVRKFDHHCPWTGKCIGEKNIWCFYLFVCCLFLHVAFVGALALLPSLSEAL